MKNLRLSLFAICMLIGLVSKAQTEFAFGVYGAPAINYVHTNANNADGGSKLMFGFGLLAEFQFSDKYSFATGIDIINKGGTLKIADTTGTYRAGYVQLPLTLKLRTREFGYFTYFATFGGAIGVQTSENVDFEPNLPVGQREKDLINPINTTFIFSLGTEYSLGGDTKVFGALQYNHALTDDIRDDASRYSSNRVYRFDYVALQLGILF